MRKTAIGIDDAKVDAVRRILGTKGITDTIDAALAEVMRQDSALRHLDRLSAMRGIDLGDPDVMEDAWR
ncbi:MAG: DUF2191 domain-containing protein [Acidimicrobiia bacterium]|nr:DUF2191 domain-containing protein [Acidimicrobiia bacterium]